MESRTTDRAFGLPDLAMIVTAACWGLNFVITKSAAGNDPGQFRIFVYNLIRFPAASALLFLTARMRGQRILIPGRYLGAIGLLSFVGIFLYQTLYMIGQTMTDSANIGIIYSFAPLFILVIAILARIEKPSVFTVAGVVFGVGGLVMIIFEGGSLSVDMGSLLFVCAVACWACYSVDGKPVLDRCPPVITMAWMFLFGSLYMAPFALYQLPGQSWGDISAINAGYVVVSALLSLYTGYTLFYYAIAKIGPAKAGIYTNLTPVFTLVFAASIRHEAIRSVQVVGLTVIIIGIFIAKINPRQAVNGSGA